MVDFLAVAITAVLLLIPGAALTFSLLRTSRLRFFEKFFVGVAVGLIEVPALLIIEFTFLQLKYSGQLVFANIAISYAAAIAALYLSGLLSAHGVERVRHRAKSLRETEWTELANSWHVIVPVLIVLLFALAFWARFSTSWATNFFEFDPVFYTHVTETLVKTGDLPTHSPEVYFPLSKNMRTYPFVAFMEASWYSIYQAVTATPLDRDALQLVGQFYPPLVGALMVFLAYLLVKEEFGEFLGLVAGALFISTPQLLTKFAAGETLLLPWGVFSSLAVFTFYSLSVNKKSLAFAGLTGLVGFAVVTGGASAVWPLSILGFFMVADSAIAFWRGEIDSNYVLRNVLFVVPALFAHLTNSVFVGTSAAELPFPIQMMALGLGLSALFYLSSRYASELVYSSRERRTMAFGAGIALLLVAALLFPAIPAKFLGFINGTAGFAHSSSALGKTIAEEGVTNPGLYFSSFGFLNPDVLLPLSAGLVLLASAISLYASGFRKLAAALVAFGIVLFFFNGLFTAAVSLVQPLFGQYKAVAAFMSSPVFAYFSVALLSILADQIFSQRPQPKIIFILVLVIFPVAFVGMNKLKYLLHLSFALTLALPFALGLIASASHRAWRSELRLLYPAVGLAVIAAGVFIGMGSLGAGDRTLITLGLCVPLAFAIVMKIANIPYAKPSGELGEEEQMDYVFSLSHYAGRTGHLSGGRVFLASLLGILFLAGLVVAFAQWGTVQNSMNQLGQTRISDDWIETYSWMSANPDLGDEACIKEYGFACRVLSWWDYGHWTTFFGQKASVLDPGNGYPEFDQEVARAFVQGNISDLRYTANYHHATTILVDAQLIQKWGALVFLSGSCNGRQSPTCPQTPEIDFSKGPGYSQYEAAHYFETLNQAGTCPAQLTGVAMPAYRSSLTGAVYCFTQNEYILLTSAGIDPGFRRKYAIIGRDTVDSNHLDPNTSYLFNYGQGAFLNANPNLNYAPVNINNTVFNAAFTRLFLFENLPGMKLIHRSKTGEVKIFKITKEFLEGKV
ncbi:hypothetical protein HY995_00350 [Candidatus Micrarchaeota archaeon]|nr:hypothetical protein [Candidatus Micrarchaeota archaeon]